MKLQVTGQATMTSDQQEAVCAQVLAGQADALKAQLLETLVLPNLAGLRAGNGTRWNEAGWYAGLDAASLAAFLAGDSGGAHFRVPADGGHWYPAETDSRSGAEFRFFHHRAWLDLPAPAAASVLRLTVLHAVLPEALDALAITVAGIPVVHTLAPRAEGGAAIELAIDADLLARAGPAPTLRIGFSTPVAAVPALVHPGSSDARLLSLALTWPHWREA